MPMDVSEYKPLFISESREHLQTLSDSLLELERNPESRKGLNEMFRAAHSLKGMAATMGYDKISNFAHSMENLLDTLRKGEKVDQKAIDLLFECVDAMSELIEDVASDGDVERDLAPIYKKLRSFQPPAPERTSKLASPKKPEVKESTKAGPTIRVAVRKVEALQDLVGELLIAKMRAEKVASRYDSADFRDVLKSIDRLVSDLEYTVLTMRMSPADYLFGKFPRIVRDMSKRVGKDIDLTMSGKEIELDRLVMDEINDAVVHLLRNAIDHGIETPDERVKLGKNPRGIIRLAARREGDYVLIEVSDDGRGIDPKALKKAAVEKGIITEDEALKLSSREAFDLLGAPGLSTLKKATEFSGRGVGFDVVRAKINSLGGSIRIESARNKGTKVILKLPLTTAIIQSLIVAVGDETYVIPLRSVQEVVTVQEETLKTIQRHEVIKHRGRLVPVLRLRDVFNTPGDRKIGPMMIVEQGGGMIGLMVDSIRDQQKVVIKPLTGILKGRREFAGATILPNGRASLILDVPGLLDQIEQAQNQLRGRPEESDND